MPRAAGQIDRQKNEAILDAATTVLSERGMAAPIETIAKLAGVSKQTIYNHYGSKAELVRALMTKQFVQVSRTIQTVSGEGGLEDVLFELACALMHPALRNKSVSLYRIIILAGDDVADLSSDVYDAGPGATLGLMARYLADADRAGLLEVEEPLLAAEIFLGMVMGHRQLRHLLRLKPTLNPDDTERVARETVRRFLRAYSPRSAD